MGITKILNIKSRPTNSPSGGLKNAIFYICKNEKTDNGRLISGNCGTDPMQAYHHFMNTKNFYSKTAGRQGYHIVISFSPEEKVSEELCQNILTDFAEEYLKNEYDYVMAVHTDTPHRHGHIVFNSVNSVTGYKYRYENGDWKTKMQPITDRICERYGLQKLLVEMEEDKDLNLRDKICNDIENSLPYVSNWKEMLNWLEKELGWKIREGFSKKHGYYVTYKLPGHKGVRSYTLPLQHTPEGVEKRLNLSGLSSYILSPKMCSYKANNYFKQYYKKPFTKWNNMNIYQKAELKKVLVARKLYGSGSKKQNWRNGRYMRDINKLLDAIKFQTQNNISSIKDIEAFKCQNADNIIEIDEQLKQLRWKYKDFTKGKDNSIFTEYERLVDLMDVENLTEDNKKEIKELSDSMDVRFVSEVYKEYHRQKDELYREKSRLKAEKKTLRELEQNWNDKKKNRNNQKQEPDRNGSKTR